MFAHVIPQLLYYNMIYKVYLFDWGNTLMVDIPGFKDPMKLWPKVIAVEGAKKTLKHLSKISKCYLVTNAQDSNEDDIWEALTRVNLDTYICNIFCYRNIGCKKPSDQFYSKIISTLYINPESIAMVGDSFENDILGAVNNDIFGYWYNPSSGKIKKDKMYYTIHSLEELIHITNKSTTC